MQHGHWPVAMALAFVTTTAPAQSQVTLYGAIDSGVERLSHVATPAGTGSLTRVPSQTAGMLPSRWGLRGSEDLGGGLKADFLLESGFVPDRGANTTSQGGRLFGRSAWVGLNGPWGALTFGRQYTMYLWALLDVDPMGPAIYGLGSLDPGIPGARSDNTLAYKGTLGGWTAGATYSFGRDASGAAVSCAGEVPGDAKACRAYSVMAKYATPAWGGALGFDEQRGGPGAAATFTSAAAADRRTVAAAFVVAGPVRGSAGWVRRDNAANAAQPTLTRRSDLGFVEADWRVTQRITTTLLWSRLAYRDSVDGSAATMYSARAAYAFSKRTAAYVTAGRITNRGSANLSVSGGTIPPDAQPTLPGVGQGQNGMMVGLRHAF